MSSESQDYADLGPDIVRDRSDDPREESRLERDDDLACVECGLVLQWDHVFLHGFARCPECHLERERERLLRAFGTLDSIDAAQVWPNENSRVDQEEDRQ